MKILLLSPAHPLRGGIAASSERLAQELQTQGHEVVVYSFKLQYPAFLFPGKTQFTDDPPPPGLLIKTQLNSINPFNWLAVGRQIAREQPERIIVRFWLPFMGPCLGTVLRVARWFSKKKPRITALVDNIIPHEKRPGDRLFAKYFVRACDDFVVMSRSVGEEILGFLGSTPPPAPPPRGRGATPQAKNILSEGKHTSINKNEDPFWGSENFPESKPSSPLGEGLGVGSDSRTAVVRYAPHPIYDSYGDALEKTEARRQLNLPETAPIVLFFGFIRAYKGLDLLLEALALAPGVHVLVAGECYEDWQPYQALIDRHQMAGRVHLHIDFIPADQVRLFFSAADLVVQPYRSATQSGISQIAYHFEKPMVVTNVGGLPEIVADGVAGYVVPPVGAALAAALTDFFQNNRAATMQAGVREEKKRFSWGYLVDALLNANPD